VNIRHFENEIDKTILARGFGYYIEGNILEVSRQGEDEYLFQIEGSEVYEVEVKLDESGRIVRSVCDCPYDAGPVCKHEAAAYYELRDIVNGDSDTEVVQGQAGKQPELDQVLNALSKKQLIEMIADIAQQDAVVKNSILLNYSRGSDSGELNSCKKLLASIVKKHTGREGFIGYRGAGRFAQEIGEVLEKAGETDNMLLAVDIACLVLQEAVKAFRYADDSDGDIGWLADEALQRINEVIADNAAWEPAIREQLFHKLLRECERTIFDGWEDYRVALLGMCARFADVETLRNMLKAKIEGFVRAYATQDDRKYTSEALLGIWLGLLREYGTAEETEQFIVDHLHYSSFRESLIHNYMQEKNYDRVVTLALEGERQDKDFPGLVLKWQEIRYAAYRELQRRDEQMELAEQLLLAGKFEYYNELRQLTGEEQEVLYGRVKMMLKQEESWRARDMYLKLIEEADDLDELLAYVKKKPGAIEGYAGRLAGKFKDEVNAIYCDHIRDTARRATNRKGYREICGLLRRYGKIAGSGNQVRLIDELRELYGNKPAFMDELDQLK